MSAVWDPEASARLTGHEFEIPRDVGPAPQYAERIRHTSPATPQAAGVLAAVRATEFLAEEIREPAWLVNEIVSERSIGFIAGDPKVFKSWLALDLAMATANAGAFCGRFGCDTPRRTLLVQLESSRAAYQKRVRAIASRYSATPSELFIVSNEALLFEDPVAMGRITRTLEALSPELLILDPLASMVSGDENSAQEMGIVVRQLRAWRDAFGCAIAVIHHTNKARIPAGESKPRSGTKLRGSSAFFAAAEWALWVERPDEEAARIEVKVLQKESESRRPFAVEFREAGAELVVVDEEVSRQVSDNEIVDAIWGRKGHRATSQELVAELEAADRTVRRRLEELVRQRKVYVEEGSGRGSKPTVYVVTNQRAAAPRLLTGDQA